MEIVIVDDEKLALDQLELTLNEIDIRNEFQIKAFMNPLKADEYLSAHQPDLVFLDIEMPVMNGLMLADHIQTLYANGPEIIFLTAYPQFSLEAWNRQVSAYVLKPYKKEKIQDALKQAWLIHKGKSFLTDRPFVRCFPDFDVFVNQTPVRFASKKAKELLALLVHHHGGWVSTDQITYAILEEAPEASAKNHIRKLTSRLRSTLTEHNCENIIESQYGKLRVIPENFECDYYKYLVGEKDLFKGMYMGEYVWAEEERAYMSHH